MGITQASKFLESLIHKFNLEWNDEQFFSVWLTDLPDISNTEKSFRAS